MNGVNSNRNKNRNKKDRDPGQEAVFCSLSAPEQFQDYGSYAIFHEVCPASVYAVKCVAVNSNVTGRCIS